MNNYDDKIVMIKNNQRKLLELVRNKLTENNPIFNLNTKKIVDVITHDDQMVKKYEAVVKAQQLIEEYTEKIKNSSSVLEIMEIRKELNKCINKVRKEMVNRGFENTDIDNYFEDIKKYRKIISQKLRFLKRENKISEIDSLNDRDDLTEEETIRLSKLVKNELSYGKRNLNADDKSTIIVSREVKVEKEEPIVTKEEPKEEIKEETKEGIIEPIQEPVKPFDKYIVGGINDKGEINKPQGCKFFVNPNDPIKVDPNKEENNEIKEQEPRKEFPRRTPPKVNNTVQNNTIRDYISDKVDEYIEKYDVIIPDGYGESIIKNLRIFGGNLYNLAHNKGTAKLMFKDGAATGYSEPVLSVYAKYIRSESGIFKNFIGAFRRSALVSRREHYREEHERCINWINKYVASYGSSEIEAIFPPARVI